MVTRDSNHLFTKLSTLSPRETQVLKLRCEGSDYKTIAQTLFITVKAVKTYVNRIYDKLELKGYGRAARLKLLFEEYCPLLNKLEMTVNQVTQIPNVPVLEEKIEETTDLVLSPEDEKILDEDEYAIVLATPTQLLPPNPDIGSKRKGIRGLLAGIAIGLCMSGVVGYLFLRPFLEGNLRSTQSTPSTSIAVIAPTDAIVQSLVSEVPTQTPFIIEIVVTTTPVPTIIPPTLTPLASVVLPFSDTFDLRARPEWETISGTWRVLDGHYTAELNDLWQITFVGDPSWRNYRIEATSFSKDFIHPIRYITRASREGYIAFEYHTWGGRWVLVNRGEEIELASVRQRLDWDREYGIIIEATDDIFTAYMDGIQFSQIQDSTYATGRAGIGFMSHYLTWFDEFRVTELP